MRILVGLILTLSSNPHPVFLLNLFWWKSAGMLGDSHKEVHMVRNRKWHMFNTGQKETEPSVQRPGKNRIPSARKQKSTKSRDFLSKGVLWLTVCSTSSQNVDYSLGRDAEPKDSVKPHPLFIPDPEWMLPLLKTGNKARMPTVNAASHHHPVEWMGELRQCNQGRKRPNAFMLECKKKASAVHRQHGCLCKTSKVFSSTKQYKTKIKCMINYASIY